MTHKYMFFNALIKVELKITIKVAQYFHSDETK